MNPQRTSWSDLHRLAIGAKRNALILAAAGCATVTVVVAVQEYKPRKPESVHDRFPYGMPIEVVEKQLGTPSKTYPSEFTQKYLDANQIPLDIGLEVKLVCTTNIYRLNRREYVYIHFLDDRVLCVSGTVADTTPTWFDRLKELLLP